MSIVIAFCNHKGGVGKTTSARNFSRALALLEKTVLMIDMDAQGSLTTSCNVQLEPDAPSIAEALLEKGPLPILRVGEYEYLVASDIRLSLAGQQLANVKDRSVRLSNLLAPLKEKFDYIVIDTPPAFEAGCYSSLRAADFAIITSEATKLSIDGVVKISTAINEVRAVKPSLQIAGIALTRFECTKSHSAGVQTLEHLFPGKVFETKVHRNIALADAPALGMSIFEYAPNSTGAAAYRALTREIVERTDISHGRNI